MARVDPAALPSFGHVLRYQADEQPDRVALICETCGGQTFSFGEWNSRTNRLASALRATGAERGATVAVLAVDCHRYAEVFFAAFKMGVAVVPINDRLVDTEIANVLQASRARIPFTSDRYLDRVASIRSLADGVEVAITFDASEQSLQGIDIAHDDFLASGADLEPDLAIADDETLVLAFTSGTTGRPKGVCQPQRMLTRSPGSIDDWIDDDELSYHASPLFHMFGRAGIFSAVRNGHASVLMPSFDVGRTLDWMQHRGVTHCGFVPTMIASLLTTPR